MQDNDVIDIISLCQEYDKTYIYGAGKNAQKLFNYLLCNSQAVAGFIVSGKDASPDKLFGVPVMEAKDYQQGERDLLLCSIIYLSPYYNDVFAKIVECQFHDVIFFSKKSFAPVATFNDCVKTERMFSRWENIFAGTEYRINNDPKSEPNHSWLTLRNDKKIYTWRIQQNHFANIANVKQLLHGQSLADEFCAQYGEYHSLDDSASIENYSVPSVKMYMAVNVNDRFFNFHNMAPYMTPIQAGASLTDVRLCDVTDNTGDNISTRNSIYSECTALYWISRNLPTSDYIGLCQYRRHLQIPNDDLRLLSLNDVDILAMTPTFLTCDIETLFSNFLPRHDIEVLVGAIEKKAPQYVTEAHLFFKSRFYPPCNTFLMRREIFKKYTEHVFAIAFEIDEYYSQQNIVRCDRYMGYLIECFLGIFLMHYKNDYHIAYVPMRFYNR